jgi:hypothetical protein
MLQPVPAMQPAPPTPLPAPGITYAESMRAPQGAESVEGEIAARIGSLNQVATSICRAIEETRQEIPHFSIAKFEARARSIAALRHLHGELQRLAAAVAKYGAAAEELHRAELKTVQEGLDRAQTPGGHVFAAPRPPAGPPPAPRPPPVLAPTLCPVGVVGGLTVDAFVLPEALGTAPEVFAAVGGGALYYVPSWKHFAVRVGGCVLHANLGRIYADPPRGGAAGAEAPQRIKECQRARCTGAACTYYHDPEKFAGSSDARNFMASSWHYTPAGAPARYGTRRFGSARDLEGDLLAVSPEEARRFLHQTAHDVLCAAILWQHVLGPAAKAPKTAP